ncbi:MAG: 4Fe-4S binding protein, partial [Rubrobacteridae bacterium]|nr:4Fe-4S binding protein [Rubrobacteridae bacterium]
HAYCPLGGLETLSKILTEGTFLNKTRPSSLSLFGAVVIVTLIAGRGFCGWICPFGSVTEWLGRLGKKASLTIDDIPPIVDSILRSLKYFILAIILIGTYSTGRMVFADYDPYPALFHFGVWTEISSAALIILATTLLLSIFIERVWCRYACPLGAITAILGRMSFIKVESSKENCRECSKCSGLDCPMGVSKSGLRRANPECIMCLRCVDGCKHGSIQVSA